MSWSDLWSNKKDDMIVTLINDRALLQAEIQDLKKGWSNPYGWSNYTGRYEIITGLEIPANTCVTINDKNIKQQAFKLKGKDITETALNIEKWIYQNTRYKFDKDNNFHKGYIEWWQPASMSFASRECDCDDQSLLFQTMMHQLGYGSETITCAGDCDFTAFKQGMVGHAFSMVYINKEWLVFDPCNGLLNRNKIKYPELKDTWFWLNYFGVYQYN